jgi:hypothetical protein
MGASHGSCAANGMRAVFLAAMLAHGRGWQLGKNGCHGCRHLYHGGRGRAGMCCSHPHVTLSPCTAPLHVWRPSGVVCGIKLACQCM